MTEMVLPQFGMGMSDGTIIAWHKAEGERVAQGELLCEVEAAKTNVEVEAPCAGILQRILVPAGANVPVNTIIALIGDTPLTGEPEPRIAAVVTPPAAPPPAAVTPLPDVVSVPVSRPVAETGERRGALYGERGVQIEPRARRAARVHGIDLGSVTGSGPGGRVIESDVMDAVKACAAQPVLVAADLPPVQHLPAATALRQLQMTCASKPLLALLQQLGECERRAIPIEAALLRLTAIALARSTMTQRGIGLRCAAGNVVAPKDPGRISISSLAVQLDDADSAEIHHAAMTVEWHDEGWLDWVGGLVPGASASLSFSRRADGERSDGDQFTIVLTFTEVHSTLSEVKSFLGILRGLLSQPLAMLV